MGGGGKCDQKSGGVDFENLLDVKRLFFSGTIFLNSKLKY